MSSLKWRVFRKCHSQLSRPVRNRPPRPQKECKSTEGRISWASLAPTLAGGLLAISGGLIASGFNARIDHDKIVREKLELAYISVLEVDSALLSSERDKKAGGIFSDPNQKKIHEPLNRIQMVGALYEPSLRSPIDAYTRSLAEIEADEVVKTTTELTYKYLQDNGLIKSTGLSDSQFAEKQKQRIEQLSNASSQAFVRFLDVEKELKNAISIATAKYL